MIFVLVFAVFLHNLHALDIQISQKEAGSYFRLESNRSLNYSGDVSVFGDIELNNQYGVRGGFALGWVDDSFEIKAFSSIRYLPFINIPLKVNLAYNYNGLPGSSFNSHANSLLPFISYNAKWAGIAAAVNFRFTNYFAEPAIFESMLAFSGYVNFINTGALLLGLSFETFNDYYIRNLGSYYINLYNTIRITDQWSITHDLELMQTGSIGLSSIFYGFAYRGGVKFTW